MVKYTCFNCKKENTSIYSQTYSIQDVEAMLSAEKDSIMKMEVRAPMTAENRYDICSECGKANKVTFLF